MVEDFNVSAAVVPRIVSPDLLTHLAERAPACADAPTRRALSRLACALATVPNWPAMREHGAFLSTLCIALLEDRDVGVLLASVTLLLGIVGVIVLQLAL